jgi:hypothetical protein
MPATDSGQMTAHPKIEAIGLLDNHPENYPGGFVDAANGGAGA